MSPIVTLLFLGTLSSTCALDWGSEDTMIQILDNYARAHMRTTADSTNVAPLDEIIDFLLSGVIPNILSHGNSSYVLPNYAKEFTFNEESIKFSAGLSAKGGELTDLKSLFRQGPAVLKRGPGGVLFLEVTAGMRRARITYEKYLLRLENEKFSGTIQVDVSPAVVSAQLQLQPPCRVLLRSLRVAALGPLRITATGLGPFAYLPKLLEELFARPALRAKMEDAVLRFASSVVQKQLDKVACK